MRRKGGRGQGYVRAAQGMPGAVVRGGISSGAAAASVAFPAGGALAGTFRAAPEEPDGCLPCDVCDQGRSYASECTASANAVCLCPPGRDCGGNACLPCRGDRKEPPAAAAAATGQQPPAGEPGSPASPGPASASLPDGAFDARSRSTSRAPRCRPSSRCPNHQTLKPGAKESDVVCQPEPRTQPPVPTTGVSPSKMTAPPETGVPMVPVAVSVAALLLCLLALGLSCLVFGSWAQEKSQEGGSARHGQPAQEVDDCSYCYPEEEEGCDDCNEASGAKWELLLEKVP